MAGALVSARAGPVCTLFARKLLSNLLVSRCYVHRAVAQFQWFIAIYEFYPIGDAANNAMMLRLCIVTACLLPLSRSEADRCWAPVGRGL